MLLVCFRNDQHKSAVRQHGHQLDEKSIYRWGCWGCHGWVPSSKWSVIVDSAVGRRRRIRRRSVPRPTWRWMLLITRARRSAEEPNPRRHDFHRSSRVVILVLVFPDLEATLHVHGVPAFQEFRAGRTEAVEGHDSKPGG